MIMTWRWYGEGNDNITLDHIRQIPDVNGIVWSLHHKVAGEVWEMEEIEKVVKQIKSKGFLPDVVESVNVHDDIKSGLPTRDKYIDIYIDTIEKLAKVGVKVICYNFMPIFDWTRTDLYKELPDGSNALFYEKSEITHNAKEMVDRILKGAGGLTMPGWEPERLGRLDELFKQYEGVTEEKLLENFKYFMERILPICEKHNIKMAIHQDDPPWNIFGLPRIVKDRDSIKRLLDAVEHPCNGLTLCTGSLGPNRENNIPDIIREFHHRIYFTHIRNVKIFDNGDFIETCHRGCHGNVDVYEVLKAYHDCGYKGYIRPDHGRHLWGEEKEGCRPGYGLYDRALGVMYLWGVWDSLEKMKEGR